MIPVEYTVTFERSQLRDGTEVVTASLRELPGVTAEGANEEAAVGELLELIRDIHQRAHHPVVGVRTPAVAGWIWQVALGSPYGAVPLEEALQT